MPKLVPLHNLTGVLRESCQNNQNPGVFEMVGKNLSVVEQIDQSINPKYALLNKAEWFTFNRVEHMLIKWRNKQRNSFR